VTKDKAPTERVRQKLAEYCALFPRQTSTEAETSDGGYILVWRLGGSSVTLKIAPEDYERTHKTEGACSVRDTLHLAAPWCGGASVLEAEPTPEMVRDAIRAMEGQQREGVGE
jgi:hypothetical protein